jgi:DNA-binding response OmpR family regulator
MKNTILIVDDDVSYVELLQILLEEEGFEVVTAFRGRKALNIMLDKKIDLVLLDYQMPEMDGFEVLDCMNNNGYETKIPVIMISANYDNDIYDSAFKKGVKYFIHKPLSWDVLIKQVDNLL